MRSLNMREVHEQAGNARISFLAVVMSIAALALAACMLFGICGGGTEDPGPGGKAVRIKNESGVNINAGMRVESTSSGDGTGSRTLIYEFNGVEIPPGLDPGGIGDFVPNVAGAKELEGNPPPPKASSWILSCTLSDGTVLQDVLIKRPGNTNGIHIYDVLARLQSQEIDGQLHYRFVYDLRAWRQLIGTPGWYHESDKYNLETPWVAAGSP